MFGGMVEIQNDRLDPRKIPAEELFQPAAPIG